MLNTKPQISYYNPPRKDVGLGGLAPGDPRSELVFATFHSNNQPKILLQGFKANDNGNTDSEEDPSPSQIARISPLAQIRAGNYRVPTFFLHGTEDDVVPASQSIDVEAALREQGVPSEVLILEGKKHLFDLYLKPRTEEYDWCVQPGYDFLAKWI